MKKKIKTKRKVKKVSGWPEKEKFVFSNEEIGFLIMAIKAEIKRLEESHFYNPRYGINSNVEEYRFKIRRYWELLQRLSERQPMPVFEKFEV